MNSELRDRDVGRFGRFGRFGRRAESHDTSPLQRPIFAPLQELTLAEAAAARPGAASLLDIGCGTGLLLRRA